MQRDDHEELQISILARCATCERERPSRLRVGAHPPCTFTFTTVHPQVSTTCYEKCLTDFSIVNVALATIQREFGVSAADLQWLVTGYALPFGRCCCSAGGSAI
jgi:hypothetical protein